MELIFVPLAIVCAVMASVAAAKQRKPVEVVACVFLVVAFFSFAIMAIIFGKELK